MPPTATAEFLRQHHPFDLLSEAERLTLASAAARQTFPKDAPILVQDGQPADHLYVIVQGSVRMSLRAHNGEEILLDLRGAGGHYGLSSMRRGLTLLNVTAAEETQCILLPRAVVVSLLQQNPAFGEAMVHASMQRYLEHSLRELQQSEHPTGSDHALLTLPTRALVRRPLAHCPPATSIQQAAQQMEAHGVSSLVVTHPSGEALGIVTDRDLRAKVLAAGLSPAAPITAIMTAPLITVEAHQSVMDTLLLLLNHNIHHVPVVEQGRVMGVVTSTDLVLLQGASPVIFASDVERQTSVGGLSAAIQRANQLLPMLFQQGARASHVARLFAEINDRVTMQLLHFAEAQVGPSPLPFSWAALGGEGRQEQTFVTDKYNALVYANPPDATHAAAARIYFSRFIHFMNDAFEQLGFPRYAPTETLMERPLREWQAFVTEALAPPATLNNFHLALFDMRPIGRNAALTLAVSDALHRAAHHQAAALLRPLAQRACAPPPTGETLDAKAHGTRLIVDIVRVLALQHRVREVNTSARLRALTASGALGPEQADELQQAFEFFLLLRLRHQFERAARHLPPDNLLQPRTLSPLDRATLREATQVIARHQNALARQYLAGK